MAEPTYYAACRPHRPGVCRGCGGPLGPRRRFYCSDNDCRRRFEADHFWQTARAAAIARATVYDPSTRAPQGAACAGCGRILDGRSYPRAHWGVPEVNHIVPVNGQRAHFACANHQSNLEVLCHPCHLQATAAQRAAGTVGTSGPLRPIVACAWPARYRLQAGWRLAVVLGCGHIWHVRPGLARRPAASMRCRACR